jgi:hypothetical protein
MSRFRRPFDQDNIIDAVFDALSSASASASGSAEAIRAKAERELLREKAREERKRRREAHNWRQLVGSGSGLLTGGMVALAWPAATIPAVGAGLLAGAAGYYVVKWMQDRTQTASSRLSGRRRQEIAPPSVDANDLPKSRRDLVQSVLDEASTALRALDRVGRSGAERDANAAGVCDRLVAAGGRLSAAVAEEPAKFEIAQRVLTYHLPRAVYVAETFLKEGDAVSAAQSREARQVLGRMEMLLEKTLLDLAEVERAEMSLEMRLINQALDEELGAVPVKRAD